MKRIRPHWPLCSKRWRSARGLPRACPFPSGDCTFFYGVFAAISTALLLMALAQQLRLTPVLECVATFVILSSQMFYATTAHAANDWLAVPLMILLFERLLALCEPADGDRSPCAGRRADCRPAYEVLLPCDRSGSIRRSRGRQPEAPFWRAQNWFVLRRGSARRRPMVPVQSAPVSQPQRHAGDRRRCGLGRTCGGATQGSLAPFAVGTGIPEHLDGQTIPSQRFLRGRYHCSFSVWLRVLCCMFGESYAGAPLSRSESYWLAPPPVSSDLCIR